MALLQFEEASLVGIVAEHAATGISEAQREGDADVTEPDDGDLVARVGRFGDHGAAVAGVSLSIFWPRSFRRRKMYWKVPISAQIRRY